MEPRLLHTRLAALGAGLALAVAVMGGAVAALPAQDAVDGDVEYGYVYSGVRSSSTAFTKAASDEDTLYVFGSSEFSTPARVVPQVPAAVFGQTDYGLHLQLVGEAYDQSLWHAIALGAYAAGDGLPGGKAVLIVAPGWFVDGGQDAATFQARFSYALYAQFCANPDVPQQAKDRVAARLRELGIDGTTVNAAAGGLPHDALNAAALGAVDDVKLRSGLQQVRASGAPKVRADVPAEPDFAALRAQALDDAAAASTNNDWGAEDAFYADQLAPALDRLAGSRADETYSDTPEYDDLACLLDVARACGVDVMVVVSPVMGPYYDHIGIDAQTRAQCYQRIADVVESHGATLADFSDREYEKYFLYDIVHFGWTGWVDVEERMYAFANGE